MISKPFVAYTVSNTNSIHMKLSQFVAAMLLSTVTAFAQSTFPVNGVADKRSTPTAFTNATIVLSPTTTVNNATLLVQDGKILAVGSNVPVPKEAQVINCTGKFIYPAFIDAFTDYGVPRVERAPGFNFFAPAQLTSNQKGAFGWNQAIRADIDAAKLFSTDDARAKSLRDLGFGAVFTHQKDGIARGTGAVVTLASDRENNTILKDKAAAVYSFSKGSSTQSYPSSMMGCIALLKQTYYDAEWYKSNPDKEGVNLSLKAFNEAQNLPQIFDIAERGSGDASSKWNALRADRIGDAFGKQYIIKGLGYEYQRIAEMKKTGATFILPLNFPAAMDVEDAADVRFVAVADMKHWELAPTQPAAFEKNAIPFCLTTNDNRDPRQFFTNLKKAIENGLSETAALEALLTTPAKVLDVADKLGSLEKGKIASFFITNGPVFADKSTILQTYIQGIKYAVKEDAWYTANGEYALAIQQNSTTQNFTVSIKNNQATVIAKDSVQGKLVFDGTQVKLNFNAGKKAKAGYKLSGINNGDVWQGTGLDSSSQLVTWQMTLVKETIAKADSSKPKAIPTVGTISYPLNGYGFEKAPTAQTLLFKNATVWTSAKDGILKETDVLLKDGKIAAIGKNLSDAGATVIDATNKHLTPGLIDEHSHIAVSSINEGGQSVTSEVRIGDNINPDDINIYRQLSGGVTTFHILHGSANTIGGQTQLLKLRWGVNDEDMKFAGADGFIKFALGENVKRSPAQQNNRFPDSRMGVEQVMVDAFTRAREYEKAIAAANTPSTAKKGTLAKQNPWTTVRRDLELDALVEILNKKRFITCHSYVQSEIVGALRVAEQFGFTLNTFTHILEGYKVAEKMKAHGAAVSTFSDWWTYKMEVVDAIPQNASIMQKVGLNVAINSDDAEMARRLNHEAAKSVKYAGMSEENALKMITINPATMLHVDKQVGSIEIGKDADVVLWSQHPLSVYAQAEKTVVDGIVYFDREKDAQLRKNIVQEKNRLMQKMAGEKRAGMPTVPAAASMEVMHSCGDHFHKHGLLVIDQH